MLVFNGIVAGTRGTCLVLSVEPTKNDPWKCDVTVLGQHKLYDVKLDYRDEDNLWWYVSKKPWP